MVTALPVTTGATRGIADEERDRGLDIAIRAMAQELIDPVITDARAASLVLLWLGDAIIAAAQDQNTDGRRRRECHCRVCCLRRPLPPVPRQKLPAQTVVLNGFAFQL